MGTFTEALKETKSSLLKIMLFEEALNAILAFLAVYLITKEGGGGATAPAMME